MGGWVGGRTPWREPKPLQTAAETWKEAWALRREEEEEEEGRGRERKPRPSSSMPKSVRGRRWARSTLRGVEEEEEEERRARVGR